MTPKEFYTHIAQFVRSRWMYPGVWGDDDKVGSIYFDFTDVPLTIGTSALQELYNEGSQTPPSPSKLMALCRRIATEQGVVFGGPPMNPCEAKGHMWSILEEAHGLRTVYCARCSHETTKPISEVPTPMEYEERKFGSGTGKTNPDPSMIPDPYKV